MSVIGKLVSLNSDDKNLTKRHGNTWEVLCEPAHMTYLDNQLGVLLCSRLDNHLVWKKLSDLSFIG